MKIEWFTEATGDPLLRKMVCVKDDRRWVWFYVLRPDGSVPDEAVAGAILVFTEMLS